MMRTRLLTTCIGITIGVSSLLGNTSAMSAAVNANDNEHGYGLTFDAPFDETSHDGMPAAINTLLEVVNNLGGNGAHSPDLPDQVPDDAPNDVPRNIPNIPDNNPDHNSGDGIGTELHGLLNTDEPDADDIRSLVEDWQEDHLIGLYNTHNENTDGLTFTTSSTTITSTPGSLITVSAVPVPAAVWLFGSGLLGLISIAKRK